MKWYEEKFVSRRDWVLDHLELLGLTVVVLMIDFMNQNRMNITIDDLAHKTNLDTGKVDETISSLCA